MTTVRLFLSVTSYLLSVTQEGAMIALSVRDRATSMMLSFILGSTESCLRSVKDLCTWHRPGVFVCTCSLVYRKAATTELWPTDSGLWHAACQLVGSDGTHLIPGWLTGEAWHTIHVHENTHVADLLAVYLSYVFRDEVVWYTHYQLKMDLGNNAGGKDVPCVTIYTVERFEWLEIKAFCSKRTFCVKNDLLSPPLGE